MTKPKSIKLKHTKSAFELEIDGQPIKGVYAYEVNWHVNEVVDVKFSLRRALSDIELDLESTPELCFDHLVNEKDRGIHKMNITSSKSKAPETQDMLMRKGNLKGRFK